MTYEDGSYRWRAGIWEAAGLTTDYEIAALAQQSDQPDSFPWFPPTTQAGAFSETASIEEAFDGSRGGYGFSEFSWPFQILTPLMVKHIRDRFFDGTGFSADATVMTWDRGGKGWIVLNCTAQWNDPAKTAEADGILGYMDFRIDFVEGEIAPSGNSMLLENGDFMLTEDGHYMEIES
jgi:hypothetical protein